MTLYKIRNILVPLDLSETSLNALQTAVALAKKHDARIHLLNVQETIASVMHPDVENNDSAEGNLDVLMALSSSIKNSNDVSVTFNEEQGCVAELIVRTGVAAHCDLIVMGSHGASGFRDEYIGSNAYNVIKYASCAVLIVPPKRRFTSFRKVLFPIRPVAGAMSPYYVASQFLASNSMVDVLGLSHLHIEKDTTLLDKIVSEVDDVVAKDNVNLKTFWGSGQSMANDVLQFAQQNSSDLIVLTHALDATPKSNFIGPHAQKVVHCAKVPLLSIKKVSVNTAASAPHGVRSNL